MPWDHVFEVGIHSGKKIRIRVDSGGAWVRVEGATCVVAVMPLPTGTSDAADERLCAMVRNLADGFTVVLDREPESIRPMADRPALKVRSLPPFLVVRAGSEAETRQEVCRIPLNLREPVSI